MTNRDTCNISFQPDCPPTPAPVARPPHERTWMWISARRWYQRICPHGWWSYQQPSRKRRWCRVCGHGEVSR